MNILHVSQTDCVGGSSRSAYRIHQGLRSRGHTSRMLVGAKLTDDDDVALMADGWRRTLDSIPRALANGLGLQYLFLPSSFLLPFRAWFKEADVIQLYNTHGDYFSHLLLPWISRLKPVVWRLSDMWPFTGHCAYSFDCQRWESGCGRCPSLEDYPGLPHDTTALLWWVKRRAYAASTLSFVSPSRWLAGLARRSPLIGGFPLEIIPNGLDTDVYRPFPKAVAKEVFGLPKDRRVLFFQSQALSDRRKGGSILRSVLERLGSEVTGNWALLVAGFGSGQWRSGSDMVVRKLGAVQDDRLMSLAFSAADVFALPTLAENFPNSLLESMACGTPVVAFGVGGISEVVRHQENGYLARAGDVDDLTAGIRQLMENPSAAAAMGETGRTDVAAHYTRDMQAARFEMLYSDLLAGRKGKGVASA